MFKVKDYPEGSNLTLLDVKYKISTVDDKGKRRKDYALVTFKNLDTNTQEFDIIYEPEYTFYVAKPGVNITNNMAFIEKSLVDPVTCKYNQLTKTIADVLGESKVFSDNIKSGNYKLNQLFYMNPRIFGADIPIINFIRIEFNRTYRNQVFNPVVGFYDIEVDILNMVGSELNPGECPVNAISLFNGSTNIIYNFILRNPENPQIESLENRMRNNPLSFQEKVQKFIEDDIGNPDRVKKYNMTDVKLSFGFFDNELEMISTFFNMVKECHLDFAVAYNAAFDLPYLIARLQRLGVDPCNIICDKDIPEKECYYHIDQQNLNEFEERCDYAFISSRTTYLDQMIIYASRRKGRSAIPNYRLDTIGSIECGVNKLDYHDITTDIAKFPYLDFETFWLYNIIDTVVQACIERETEDLSYVFNNALEMCTSYQKIFRQTVYLSTRAYEFYYDEGFIMGNNANKFNTEKVKFPGAFVADPKLISDRNKCYNHGYINKFYNANDFDYTSLYPSLIREFNMASHTQIGKIEIKDSPYKDPDYLRLGSGGSFNENFASHNYIEFCHRWMGMGNIEETLHDVKEYYTKYKTPQREKSMDKPLDGKRIQVIDRIDINRPISIDRPIPQWVKDRVDEHRREILYGKD